MRYFCNNNYCWSAQVRTLSLIIVTFTYLLVGAAIFDALEGPNNEKVKEGLVQLREKLKLKYEMTEDDYKMMEVLIEEKKPHKTGPQWKFAGSLYYAFVTLALIGGSIKDKIIVLEN